MLKPKPTLSVVVLGILLVVLLPVLAACAGQPASASSSERIRAKWIKADVSGTTASISLSEVRKNGMSHFPVTTADGKMAFMAYELENKLYVRADICPPCRSEQFSLKGTRLICDTCSTVFDARTGDGIQGACVLFPKEQVAYEINSGKMVMKTSDLAKAYADTMKSGR